MEKPKYTVWVKYYVKHYWYLILFLVILTIGAVLLDMESDHAPVQS